MYFIEECVNAHCCEMDYCNGVSSCYDSEFNKLTLEWQMINVSCAWGQVCKYKTEDGKRRPRGCAAQNYNDSDLNVVNKAKLWPISAPRLIKDLRMNE